MTGFVTHDMRRAADEARNAALRNDENDQIGALNAALDAAFASIMPTSNVLDKVTDAVRKADEAIAADRYPGLPPEVIAAAAERISGDYLAMAQAAIDAFPAAADALRYKSMFDDAVAQHNAQMARAEEAEADVAQLTDRLSKASAFFLARDVSVERRDLDLWIISNGRSVRNTFGEWEYEPLPSSRSDEFIARTRFPFGEAWRIAEDLAGAASGGASDDS